MKKKLTIVLTLLFVFLLPLTCFANERFVELFEEDGTNVSLDTLTFKTYGSKDDPHIECWLKFETDRSCIYKHTYIRIATLNYLEAEADAYGKDGTYYGRENNRKKGWRAPIPNSRGEYVILSVISWAMDNKLLP